MDEVGCDELGEERRYNIGEKNDALRDGGANEVKGGGEDDYVEDIIDEAYEIVLAQLKDTGK